MAKRAAVAVLVVILIAILVWSPWMTPQQAEGLVMEAFTAAWQGVVDGCGFNCQGCGATASHRQVIGYVVEIEYACGLIPYDSPDFHQVDTVYVSFIGSVHGLAVP